MLKEIPYTVNDIAVSLAMTAKGLSNPTKQQISDLTREACMHLSNPKSTATLRDLCRRFLDQHKM